MIHAMACHLRYYFSAWHDAYSNRQHG